MMHIRVSLFSKYLIQTAPMGYFVLSEQKCLFTMAQIGVYEKDYNGLNTPLLLNFVKKNPFQTPERYTARF